MPHRDESARMRRPERKRTIREKVARFRDAVPGVAIRTTCIVGFPGEAEGDFNELLEFLEEIAFDRVGAFTYSPQEGTRAAELADDVPDALKRERLERLTELQRSITSERYETRVGTVARAIVDRQSLGGSEARFQWQADDIDGITHLHEAHPPGTFWTSPSGSRRGLRFPRFRRRRCGYPPGRARRQPRANMASSF